MKKSGNIIYGTVKECVDELFNLIDLEKCIFPNFDFSAETPENAETPEEALDKSNYWFSCNKVGHLFDSDCICVVFGHYGGGGFDCIELRYNEKVDDLKSLFIRKIYSSTEDMGLNLTENEYTVFELHEKAEKN